MKKVAFWIVGFLVVASGLNAAPILVEAYQEGSINEPPNEWDTITVTKVSLSLDSARYVQFATGGIATLVEAWLELNGEELPPHLIAPSTYDFINITYTYLLPPGEHEVSFQVKVGIGQSNPSTCKNGYLQALIFLPDAGGAIAERPAGDAEPTSEMKSVISKGPYVTVTGATELVDATGRVIENAITEDRVSINALPQGTYFARDGERTVVKIVKVQ